jgi:hypothetical protein
MLFSNSQHFCLPAYYPACLPAALLGCARTGELQDIERSANRTEVIVAEGANTISYALDEQLIEALTLIQACGMRFNRCFILQWVKSRRWQCHAPCKICHVMFLPVNTL